MYSTSNVNALQKKLQEIHDYDGATFETNSVLTLIEGILNLVTSGMENELTELCEFRSISDTLHKISCVFNCKCLDGDAAMEIMKLVSRYEWEAKIAIVLATFVVEYAQFSHAIKLYNGTRLGELVSNLKEIPSNIDDCFYQMKSKFQTLIEQSIQVTKLIAQFSSLGCKYISNDVEPMANALNQIPIDVYEMTKVVVACASQLRDIGKSEIDSSTEIWYDESLKLITSSHSYFKYKHDLCCQHIDGQKLTRCVEKLKKKFNQTTVYVDNQKILQLIINTKDHSHPLESGQDQATKVGLEALKGKTVLLFISGLDIPKNEIFMLEKIYQESRLSRKEQYEIVWLPTEENIETDAILQQKFEEQKSMMQWYCLQHPSLLKRGVVKYMEEVLHYSKKSSILVALNPKGKIVNNNAFKTVWKWGNAAYPFTDRCELDLCNRMKWSLQLLVSGMDQNLTNWIREGKIICLFGGKDKTWIEEFVTSARKVENDGIKIKMMYIGKDPSEEVTEILEKWECLILSPKSSGYFLERIETMKASVTDGSNKESTVVEMGNMHRLCHSNSWALISQGAGVGAGEIARGVGDQMLRGLQEFESWRAQAGKGFVVALNGHVAGWPLIPPPGFCTVCHRSINGCYTQ